MLLLTGEDVCEPVLLELVLGQLCHIPRVIAILDRAILTLEVSVIIFVQLSNMTGKINHCNVCKRIHKLECMGKEWDCGKENAWWRVFFRSINYSNRIAGQGGGG